jgi:hypothetical protein
VFFLADGPSIFANLGNLIQGTTELLALFGAGIGFVIRSRRNSRREKIRTEAAARLAAQETTKTTLEARLEAQHAAQVKQFQDQIDSQREQYEDQLLAQREQAAILRSQNSNLQQQYNRLVERLLNQQSKEDEL